MKIHFKILDSIDSASIGNIYEVSSGHVIGRARGNIILEDERISSVHAEIQMNNQGEMFLVDKDSRNGIKVQGKRITKLLITPGTIFQVGNTLIEVFLANPKPKMISSEISQESLISQAKNIIESTEVKHKPLEGMRFFSSTLRLDVIQGLQLDQAWELEYGPYRFGSGCVGGILVGKNYPPEIFEITELNSKVVVRALSKNRILSLNSIPIVNESLVENGDILSVETEDILRIKISF